MHSFGRLSKSALTAATGALTPAAWCWARRGYFRRGPARRWLNLPAESIAIIACHWVGDTFWATQVVGPLRRRFGAARIHAVTKSACVDLWNGLIESKNVLAADAVVSDRRRERTDWPRLWSTAETLRRRAFDLVIDLTGNRYSAALSFAMRPAAALGFDGGELRRLYSLRVGRAERPCEHLRMRPIRVIEPLIGAEAAGAVMAQPPRAPAASCDPAELIAGLSLEPRRYFVLCPGAGWPAKRWPAGNFIAAARALTAGGARLIVVGSAAERDLCNRVAGSLPRAAVQTYSGQPLGRVMALLGESAGLLCNDSGLGHLAAALGRPTAVVFTGATDPAVCRPVGAQVRVFAAPASVEPIADYLLAQCR